MSTRYEGAYAKYVGVEILTPGTEIGDDALGIGKYAVALSYDEVFYIEGTPDELVNVAESILHAAQDAQEHATRPTQPEDFIVREEEVVCPRCGWTMELDAATTVGGITSAALAHLQVTHPRSAS